QQSAAPVVILGVPLVVLGEVLDAIREQRDLHFRRPGVVRVRAVLGDDVGLGRERHGGMPSSARWRSLVAPGWHSSASRSRHTAWCGPNGPGKATAGWRSLTTGTIPA